LTGLYNATTVCSLWGTDFIAFQLLRSSVKNGRTMAQTIRCRPITAETQVRCEICGGQSNTESVFSPRFYFTLMFHPYLHLNVAVTRTNSRSLGTLQKAMLYRQTWSVG